MRRYWVPGVASATVVTALMSSPSMSSAETGNAVSPTTTVQSQLLRPQAAPRAALPIQDAVASVQADAGALFGDDYAGVTTQGSSVIVLVKASAPSPIPARFEGHETRAVGYSLKELKGGQARLDAGQGTLESSGVTLASWGVAEAENAVSVSVVLGAGQTVESVRSRVGSVVGDVRVTLTAVNSLDVPSSRTADYAPHNGGAQINSSGSCTSGLFWYDPNSPQWKMMTAGHCGPVMTNWSTNAGSYGVTSWNALLNSGLNRIDASAILPTTSGEGYFYVGPPGGNGLVHVGYYYPGFQTSLCGLRTSGAVTGEYYVSAGSGCVTETDITVNYGGSTGTVYHMNRAYCKSIAGDSGGPVFKVINSGDIAATGVISGTHSSNVCNYVPVQAIIDQYGGSPGG